jgi:hypothetical protein
MGVRDFSFNSGTQPLGPESQMCLNISITDDPFLEPIEIFSICGSSQQNSVVVVNGGCTNIFIRDNEGSSYYTKIAKTEYKSWNFFPVVIISPPSPNGIYTVEVQRTLIVTCSGSNSDDIVAWIRKC